jgi:hypothetical protein
VHLQSRRYPATIPLSPPPTYTFSPEILTSYGPVVHHHPFSFLLCTPTPSTVRHRIRLASCQTRVPFIPVTVAPLPAVAFIQLGGRYLIRRLPARSCTHQTNHVRKRSSWVYQYLHLSLEAWIFEVFEVSQLVIEKRANDHCANASCMYACPRWIVVLTAQQHWSPSSSDIYCFIARPLIHED